MYYFLGENLAKKIRGNLDGDKIIITDLNSKSLLCQRSFGKLQNKVLILDLYEALYLIDKDSLTVYKNKKKLSLEQLTKTILRKNSKKYLMHRFAVYKDLRSKGYILKTGLKFGFDFRVYPKGKKIDEAHTQYVIEVLSESEKLTNHKIAKSTRMAIGLHTSLILAIVDNELDISYYKITREIFQ